MSKSEPLGQGSLALLEELKAKWGPVFKAQAPKSRHKIDQRCADLHCSHLPEKVQVKPGGVWFIKSGWCTEKRCPKEKKMIDDKLTVEDLEQLAHELYEAWMADRDKAEEKWQKYLKVKRELDARKGLT